MKLKIDFEEIVGAFELSDVNSHYFIDTQENILVYVNEVVESDVEERLEQIEEAGDRYVHIPTKFPDNDFHVMEGFVYELQEENSELADELYEELHRSKPFRNFKELLAQHPEVREKWFSYKDKAIRNEAIDWLVEKGIELEGQELIPKIEVDEVKELEKLPEDVKGFLPVVCATCENKERLEPRLFAINLPPENRLVEKETKRIMKERYGVSNYGNYTGGEKEILTAAKCPKCGSEDVIWDYRQL